jgi:hypothetical protein
MLIALAALLALLWILAFFVLHVTFIAIHSLAFCGASGAGALHPHPPSGSGPSAPIADHQWRE